MQSLPTATEKNAEMALLAGDVSMAEGILLQSSLIKEAIHLNIQIYNWNRYVKSNYAGCNYKICNSIINFL